MTTTDNSRADALTAQEALAAIETFEIVGENNDSREPNDDDRFILTEFIAHAFGGYPVEQHEAAPADVNQLLEAAALGLERAGMLDCMRIVRGMKPGYPKQPAPASPLEGTGNGADERVANPIGYIRADDLKELAAGNGAIISPKCGATDVPVFARAPRTEVAGAEAPILNRKEYEYAQPGSPEFDGAEAYEQYLAKTYSNAEATEDERADCITWANANGFTKYHESMCAAWEERGRRAAASQPAAGQETPEPVCWITKEQLEQLEDLTSDAWVYWRETGHVAEDDELALYTAPPAQVATRQGLTDEPPYFWRRILDTLNQQGITWTDAGWVFTDDDRLYRFGVALLEGAKQ